MASLNGVITRDPEILGGTPVFRGTRVPFQALLDYIEGGQTLDEFLDNFPYRNARGRNRRTCEPLNPPKDFHSPTL